MALLIFVNTELSPATRAWHMKVTLLAENVELHQELCTSLADGHFQFADIITKPPVLFVEVFIVKIFKVLCTVK